jgi:protein SPT2
MTSNGFAALMALSQAQTQESTRAADSIQAERRRKEEIRRRQQEEEDRKERERQAKMLRHHLEEQKREKERQEKQEQEREAKLKEMERREEEQRQALLYGPRKAREGATSRYPTSSSASASKRTSDDDDDGEADGGPALTREEKRERRLQLQFSQNSTRRAGVSLSGTSRVGSRLPGGGAIKQPTTTGGGGGKSASGGHSVRARLAAMPNTLTKLNTVKRDTRTIDEILRDRAKARENKTLEGEDAREFHDWFGTKPKDGGGTMMAKATSSPPSSVPSGASTPSGFSHRADATSTSGRHPSSPRPTGSRALPPLSRPSTKTATSTTKSSSHAAKLSRPFPLTNKAASSSSASLSLPKKRPPQHSAPSSTYYSEFEESDSEYDERPPRKRPAPGPSSNGIQDEIWKIFGRDRSKYMSRDVLSDDEDMEADIRALEREELTRCVSRKTIRSFCLVLMWWRFKCSDCPEGRPRGRG